LPNVGPYIYTTLAFLALLGAPYIYEISSLRVNKQTENNVSVWRHYIYGSQFKWKSRSYSKYVNLPFFKAAFTNWNEYFCFYQTTTKTAIPISVTGYSWSHEFD